MGKTTSNRIVGFDLARALAILGMVVVNYKIVMNPYGDGPNWLVSFTGIFEGRASAIFVILAGIGISLMTKRARQSLDQTIITNLRITIWKRSLFLLLVGMGLFLLEWDADILHYYAVYMFIASLFIVVSNKKLLGTAAVILVSSQILQVMLDYSEGWDASFHTYETFWTINGFLRNLFFNGYHPVFPWVCFFLFGMWIGRFDFSNQRWRKKILILSIIWAIILELSSYILIQSSSSLIGTEIAQYLFSTKPMPPNMLYILSSSSTSLIVIILCINLSHAFKNHALMTTLVYTGQMALTHYVGHFVVLIFLDVFGLLESSTLLFAVLCSVSFFIAAMIFSYVWRRRFKRGPIEWGMRRVSD